ncbi:hypothetical protein ABT338_35180, partial [Streptosporangium saharense]
ADGSASQPGRASASRKATCRCQNRWAPGLAGSVVVLDTLGGEHYARQRPPGAIALVESEVAERAAVLLPDKDADIVTCCSSPGCGNGEAVARRLTALGTRTSSAGRAVVRTSSSASSTRPPASRVMIAYPSRATLRARPRGRPPEPASLSWKVRRSPRPAAR